MPIKHSALPCALLASWPHTSVRHAILCIALAVANLLQFAKFSPSKILYHTANKGCIARNLVRIKLISKILKQGIMFLNICESNFYFVFRNIFWNYKSIKILMMTRFDKNIQYFTEFGKALKGASLNPLIIWVNSNINTH